MAIRRSAALLLIAALSGTALAEGPYTLRYVEITPLEQGKFTARFVEKQADLTEMLAQLKSPDEHRRLSAVKAVQWSKDWAEADRKALIEAMGERLADDAPSVRYWASKTLWDVGPDAAAILPALIKAAEEEESLIKVNAMAAIGNIGPAAKPAIPALTKLLRSDERFIPMHAGDALARIGPESVPALIEAFKSEKQETRIQAMDALGWMGTDAKSAIPALERMPTGDDVFLQFRVGRTVELIGQLPRVRYWVYGKERDSEEPAGEPPNK